LVLLPPHPRQFESFSGHGCDEPGAQARRSGSRTARNQFSKPTVAESPVPHHSRPLRVPWSDRFLGSRPLHAPMMTSSTITRRAPTASPKTTTSEMNGTVPPAPTLESRYQRTNPNTKPTTNPVPTMRPTECETQGAARRRTRFERGPDVGSSGRTGGRSLEIRQRLDTRSGFRQHPPCICVWSRGR
jgi:hypothetical protein